MNVINKIFETQESTDATLYGAYKNSETWELTDADINGA